MDVLLGLGSLDILIREQLLPRALTALLLGDARHGQLPSLSLQLVVQLSSVLPQLQLGVLVQRLQPLVTPYPQDV